MVNEMLITARKAAKMLGLSMPTIYRLVKNVEPVKKVGKEKYYQWGELQFVVFLGAEKYEDRRWDCDHYGKCLRDCAIAVPERKKMGCWSCKKFVRARLTEEDFLWDLECCKNLFAAIREMGELD